METLSPYRLLVYTNPTCCFKQRFYTFADGINEHTPHLLSGWCRPLSSAQGRSAAPLIRSTLRSSRKRGCSLILFFSLHSSSDPTVRSLKCCKNDRSIRHIIDHYRAGKSLNVPSCHGMNGNENKSPIECIDGLNPVQS